MAVEEALDLLVDVSVKSGAVDFGTIRAEGGGFAHRVLRAWRKKGEMTGIRHDMQLGPAFEIARERQPIGLGRQRLILVTDENRKRGRDRPARFR